MTDVKVEQCDKDCAAEILSFSSWKAAVSRDRSQAEHAAECAARHRQSAEKATREECAKVADDYATKAWGMTEEGHAAEQIATAIRSQNDD